MDPDTWPDEVIAGFRAAVRALPGWPTDGDQNLSQRLFLWDQLMAVMQDELRLDEPESPSGYPHSISADPVAHTKVLAIRPVMLEEGVANASITLTHVTVYPGYAAIHFFARSHDSGPFQFSRVDAATADAYVPCVVWHSSANRDWAGATHEFSILIETDDLDTSGGLRLIFSGNVLTTRLDAIVDSSDRRLVFYVSPDALK